MQVKIQTIMDQTASLDDPAPLVLFALHQPPAQMASALDALEAVRIKKAADVETICTEYYGEFTRAMGALECIRGGMSTLGREAAAQNDELQAAGRPLLQCFEEIRTSRVEDDRTFRAAAAVARCQAALEAAAAAREALRQGALFHALRHVACLEMDHLPMLPCSALARHLTQSTGPAREAVARAADKRATDWLVSARQLARVIGAAEMATLAASGTGRSSSSGGGDGGGLRRRRSEAVAAAQAGDAVAVKDIVARSVAAARTAAAAANASNKTQLRQPHQRHEHAHRRGDPHASTTTGQDGCSSSGVTADGTTRGREEDGHGGGGSVGVHYGQTVSGSGEDGNRVGNPTTPIKRRIDFTAAVAGMATSSGQEREDQGGAGESASGSGGGGGDGICLSGLSLKAVLQSNRVFEVLGRGQEFAARIRRERALQLKADLNFTLNSGGGGGGGNGSDGGGGANGGVNELHAGSKVAPDGDEFLRRLVGIKLTNFVGFFIIQERLSRALPCVLATTTSRALCSQACDEVGALAVTELGTLNPKPYTPDPKP
jgi:hypothetical protein